MSQPQSAKSPPDARQAPSLHFAPPRWLGTATSAKTAPRHAPPDRAPESSGPADPAKSPPQSEFSPPPVSDAAPEFRRPTRAPAPGTIATQDIARTAAPVACKSPRPIPSNPD